LSIQLFAQKNKKIQINNADKTYANVKIHPEYWKLIGNVSFSHNGTIMNCDSAYHYINENRIKSFGSIKINQGDSILLIGRYLDYFGKNNTASLKGNVKFQDKHMTLETEQINYNLLSKTASYPNRGIIIDNEKTIKSKKGSYQSSNYIFNFIDSVTVFGKDYKIFTDNMKYNSKNEISYFYGPSLIVSKDKKIYCENGWYNTKQDIAQFRKNAYISNKSNVLKGDSLYYDKRNSYGKAIGNVLVIDTLNNIFILGGLAEYYEQNDEVIITKKPTLKIIFESDTLFMHARKFINQNKINKKIIAYNKVKFFKLDLQGKCDSLSYNFKDSVIEMYKEPIIWSENFQMTSDSIQFEISKNQINKMYLINNPIIVQHSDSTNFNQIKGKIITGYFSKNKISSMRIIGNGQSIFHVNDENNKIGVNYTESTDLTLYFKKNKLDKVNYELKPKSLTIPYENIKEEYLFLKGFNWRISEKPKNKNDIY